MKKVERSLEVGLKPNSQVIHFILEINSWKNLVGSVRRYLYGLVALIAFITFAFSSLTNVTVSPFLFSFRMFSASASVNGLFLKLFHSWMYLSSNLCCMNISAMFYTTNLEVHKIYKDRYYIICSILNWGDRREPMKYRLSPSALNLYKECQRCFWLTQNKVWKRPSGIFPSLPTGMDRILKQYFDTYAKKRLLPPEIQHLEGYQLFDDEKLLQIWRNNF